MFSKIKMKWLAGLFAILLLLAVIVTVRNRSNSASSKNRSFKSELVSFDSSAVSAISIDPRYSNQLIELKKTGEGWKLVTNEAEYNADDQVVGGMISNLLSLRAKRIASKSKDQWKNFEVTDSLATRVKVYAGKKEVLNILLGKFSYQQPKNANPYMYQQQQGSMTSYVRLEGDKEVFATDGMIAMAFNRQPNDFRNRSLIRSENENWNRISVAFADESYALVRQGDNWTIDGLVTDSTATAKYVSALAWLSSPAFAEAETRTSGEPACTMKIEGENMESPIKIDAFEADSLNGYVLTSSLNKGTYFSGNTSGLFSKVFKPKKYFFAQEIKE
jgi:hypothetical protein